MKHAIWLATLGIIATPLAAQDYLAAQEQFAFAAKAMTSARSCENFGYDVDDDEIERMVDDALSSAVMSDISVDMAQSLASAALEEERERQNFISGQLRKRVEGSETPAEIRSASIAFFQYWLARCADLSADPRTAASFVAGDLDYKSAEDFYDRRVSAQGGQRTGQ